MGQSKLKKSLHSTPIPPTLLSGISVSLRKLTRAASEHYGADCASQAILAQAVLKQHGFETKLVAGYAAWRVGEGDSDVISHIMNASIPEQQGAMVFHVWLEHGDRFLDFTTYQLKEKAAQLDALDGGSTQVDWCPEYIYTDKKDVSPVSDVLQLHAGMYHYERNAQVESVVFSHAQEADKSEVAALMVIVENPGIDVMGPSGSGEDFRAGNGKPTFK